MKQILFVCLGNICRSVAAEEVFRTLALQRGADALLRADSAGLIDYHEGELADLRMRAAAARRGYRLTHRSRPVTAADFSRFDLIAAMDSSNVRSLLQAAPRYEEAKRKVFLLSDCLQSHEADFIPDPYYGSEADFEHVLDLLEDACQGLLSRLLAENG